MRWRRAWPLAALAAVAALAGPVGAEEPSALVSLGQRWWTRSPDPANPVSCATCHHDPARTRGWAASFPKFRPLPPPAARVMTLVQATAEAVERHYRVRDPLPAATALAAYLGARGAGTRVTPGISDGEPVFTSRLEALARSVERGRRLFAARCRACHADADAGSLVEGFPRMREAGAQSLEAFLEGHSAADAALTWDGAPMADLVAYLVSHRAGRPFEGAAGPAPTPAP